MSASIKAVELVERRAAAARSGALARMRRHLDGDLVDELAAGTVDSFGRLTLNFHPDRTTRTGRTVAAGLLADGYYRNQWETWLSNGSRSAIHGGERHGWEVRMFEGSYEAPGVVDAERPVYGSVDLLSDPHGGSPRFGSGYVVLRPEVATRTTMCVGDSHVGPTDVGTYTEPLSVIAGLVEQAAAGDLLGRPLGLADLADALRGRFRSDRPSRCLDGYVEAQVHGGVDLGRDVEAIVLDPSFRERSVGDDLREAADRHGFELRWHGGSELDPRTIPTAFRGPGIAELGERVARDDGLVDAAAIGRAVADVAADRPDRAGDAPDSDRQRCKYLWHAVLALGRDATAPPAR